MILGAVLTGGRSSRFGSDKAMAMLGGLPLVERAASVLAPHVGEVVTVGGPPRDGLAHVPDRPAPDLGPLGGLAGALAHAEACGFDAVLTIACDTPAVSPDLLQALLRRGPSFCEDAPTLGYWPADLSGDLLAWLSGDGDRSIRRWARAMGALPIRAEGPVPNVNTPDDLAALA